MDLSGLGHLQVFFSLELPQHISAANLFSVTLLLMKKHPCLPFLPRNISRFTCQVFLKKGVEIYMNPGQECQDPWSVFPWNSSRQRVQPYVFPTGK